jgi:small subunit ribosomal protein S20
MPNTAQAQKALRKDAKKAERNLKIKQDLKTLIKKTKQAIEAKDAKVVEMIKQVQVSIDKAVQKGVIKKNTGSRKLSRVMSLHIKTNKSAKDEPIKEDKQEK